MANEEFGGYGQVAGFGLSAGINNEEGLSFTAFAQGSMGVAGLASIGFTVDITDWDFFGWDDDPTDRIIDFTYGTYVGAGTPPGSPVAIVRAYDPRTNTYLGSVGFGIGDWLEIGGYGQGVISPSDSIIETWSRNADGTITHQVHTVIGTAWVNGERVDLRAGDLVFAFDPSANFGRGALVPRKVTGLYRNTTTEWIKLTWRAGLRPGWLALSTRSLMGGRAAVGLFRAVERWSKAIEAREVLLHVTGGMKNGLNSKTADHLGFTAIDGFLGATLSCRN